MQTFGMNVIRNLGVAFFVFVFFSLVFLGFREYHVGEMPGVFSFFDIFLLLRNVFARFWSDLGFRWWVWFEKMHFVF